MPWTTERPTRPGTYFVRRESCIDGFPPLIFPLVLENHRDPARLTETLTSAPRSIDGHCYVMHAVHVFDSNLQWWSEPDKSDEPYAFSFSDEKTAEATIRHLTGELKALAKMEARAIVDEVLRRIGAMASRKEATE